MKHLALCLLAVLTLAACTESAPVTGQPPSIQPKLAAFGTLIQGDTTTASFEITNPNSVPLPIDRIHPTCGCLTVSRNGNEPTQKFSIDAGDSVTIDVTLDSSTLSGADIKRQVQIVTGGPNRGVQLFTWTGAVTPLFESSGIWKLAGLRGTTLVGEFALTPTESVPGNSLTIESIRSRAGHVEIAHSLGPTGITTLRLTAPAVLSERSNSLIDGIEIIGRDGAGTKRTAVSRVQVVWEDPWEVEPRGVFLRPKNDGSFAESFSVELERNDPSFELGEFEVELGETAKWLTVSTAIPDDSELCAILTFTRTAAPVPGRYEVFVRREKDGATKRVGLVVIENR